MLREENSVERDYNTAFLIAFICFVFNLGTGFLNVATNYRGTLDDTGSIGLTYVILTSISMFFAYQTCKNLAKNAKVRNSPL
jgi:hypothetical protein